MMEEQLKKFTEFWTWAESVSDPRVADWFLIPSPVPTYVMSLFYIIFSWKIGPWMMRNREPFNLKYTLVVYNLFMTLLNLHIFKELGFGMLEAGYTFPCQPYPTTTRPADMRIASALWLYFISKSIEYIDTLFFILRKKQSHVSFLHVYHHSTMSVQWWIVTKWTPAGQAAPAAMLNAFIHIVMYFYYGMAALGPSMQKYLWWKRYLTQMQLIQFCIALTSAVHTIYSDDCEFPKWMCWILIVYMITFLILFGNFYVQSYLKKSSSKLKKTKEEEGSKTNGFKNTENKLEVTDNTHSPSKTHLRARNKP